MNTLTETKRENRLYLVLLSSLLLPYLFYGFRYFPILDDYIQFWAYPAREDLSYVYLTIGTLSIRPLAHLLDPLFWGQFWPLMGFAMVLVSLLLFFSAVLFARTLKAFDVHLSPFFFLIYLLFPLGMEGRYWLSSSTRIVIGLFFTSISLHFLSEFLKKKDSALHFSLFFLFQLISCGFYESVTVFSVSSAVLLFLLGFSAKRKKRFFLVPLVSVLNIGLMFLYYRTFAGLGPTESRAAGLSLEKIPENISAAFSQVKEAFSMAYDATVIGCLRGVSLLTSGGFWGIFLLILIVFCSLVLAGFVKNSRPYGWIKTCLFVGFGAMLFVAPLVPNLLAENVWVTNRSIFVSLIGLSLMMEPLWALLQKKSLRKCLCFLVSFLFLTATVNEYDIYRRANLLDQRLLGQVVSQIEFGGAEDGVRVCVFLPEEVKVEQNASYKDHVKSVFDSDWALTGALREKVGDFSIAYACPVLPGMEIDTAGMQVVTLENVAE